jgi:hypothetical protein
MLRSYAVAALLVLCAACSAGEQSPAQVAPGSNGSALCAAVQDQFIPLPADLEHSHAEAPAAGRWWIRSCTTTVDGADVRVSLQGPAWYWVETKEGAYRVRQHVYFRTAAELTGRFQEGISWQGGVISLWFHPSDANVHIEPVSTIHTQPRNFMYSALKALAFPVPGYNSRDLAKQQFDHEATVSFEEALRRGYTLVYDIDEGRMDFALDLLAPGELPYRPFDDGTSWLANERLLLAPGGAHVLGPFDDLPEAALDVRPSRGNGLAYRAVCASDLRRVFGAAEQDHAVDVPARDIVATGQVRGSKPTTQRLGAIDCNFYLVLTALDQSVSEAAVRLRG